MTRSLLYVVIPVYNEAQNVERLVSTLWRLGEAVREEFELRVVVVDDASRDDTAGRLTKAAQHPRDHVDLEILLHDANRGPGAAFATGFRYLAPRIRATDWIATMEGDNTSRIETLVHMLTRRKEGYDAVLASVYTYGGGFVGTPWWRLAVSHAANEVTLSVLRLYGLRTLSSFFRLHSAPLLLKLQATFGPAIVESAGFEWAVEMLYKMALLNARISEVETQVDWRMRAGVSKMRTFRTMRGYLRVLARHRRWKTRLTHANRAS